MPKLVVSFTDAHGPTRYLCDTMCAGDHLVGISGHDVATAARLVLTKVAPPPWCTSCAECGCLTTTSTVCPLCDGVGCAPFDFARTRLAAEFATTWMARNGVGPTADRMRMAERLSVTLPHHRGRMLAVALERHFDDLDVRRAAVV